MKTFPKMTSCKTCLFLDEEQYMIGNPIYSTINCLYLLDATGLTSKDNRKIQKTLLRYETQQSPPYCKFYSPTIVIQKSIKKKAIDFVKKQLE